MISSVQLLEMALETAKRHGYVVRHEWLGGVGGASCEVAGKKLLFVDLAIGVEEQLEQIESALIDDPVVGEQKLITDVALQMQSRSSKSVAA